MLWQVQMVKDIQQASRQLNKRQMTWFRDDPMYQWLDAKQPIDVLVQQIVESMEQSKHVGNVPWHLQVFKYLCMGYMCCHAQKLDLVSVWCGQNKCRGAQSAGSSHAPFQSQAVGYAL